MEKVTLIPYESIYENFIDKKYLHDGLDEYYFRYQQVKKPANDWRHLRSDEIERLVKNSNTATSWDDTHQLWNLVGRRFAARNARPRNRQQIYS